MFNKTRFANLCDRYIAGYWHNSTLFQLEYDYFLFGIRLATPEVAGSLQITLINGPLNVFQCFPENGLIIKKKSR